MNVPHGFLDCAASGARPTGFDGVPRGAGPAFHLPAIA